MSEAWARTEDERQRTGLHQSGNDRTRSERVLVVKGGVSASSARAMAAPRSLEQLSDEARRALDDFGYFRKRYFGRSSMPWAEDAAHRLDALRVNKERSFVVVNAPPGAGKTTILHDFCVWETCKTRWMRGLWGSATSQLAGLGTKNIRNTLSRATPVMAKLRDIKVNYAADAEATLVSDFGRFQPVDGGVWRAEMFVVEQFDETSYDDKEATWAAFGENSEEIGYRADLIVWDDLVTKDLVHAKLERMERHREWFDDVAEERLEPDGLFVLMGQRLAANDTYRYALDKLVIDELDFEGDDEAEADWNNHKRMYEHIVYKAHDAEHCKGEETHRLGATPWHPDGTGGCLIDPHRLSWKTCKTKMRDPQKWATVYQQEDASSQEVLVQKLWVDGGRDNITGELHFGAWDEHRGACERPRGEDDQPIEGLVSYMSVDPSSSRLWGITWWCYDRRDKKRYLMDLYNGRLTAGDFLDQVNGNPIGLAHDWVIRSQSLGVPITAMVVENNAAQRYLLQYEHVREWSRRFGVRIIAHSTMRNKTDPDFGVQTLSGIWKQGLVRLPGKSRLMAKPLVREVTTYPYSVTADLVMSQWFGEFNLTTITAAQMAQPFRRVVPSWLQRERAFA